MVGSITPFRRNCRITLAALIKAVFEVNPLKYPKCAGTMKIISFFEEAKVIEKIVRHSCSRHAPFGLLPQCSPLIPG